MAPWHPTPKTARYAVARWLSRCSGRLGLGRGRGGRGRGTVGGGVERRPAEEVQADGGRLVLRRVLLPGVLDGLEDGRRLQGRPPGHQVEINLPRRWGPAEEMPECFRAENVEQIIVLCFMYLVIITNGQ